MKDKEIFYKDDPDGPTRSGVVKWEVTPDFVLDLYEEAKEQQNEKVKEEMMKQVELFSKNIGALLVSEEKTED